MAYPTDHTTPELHGTGSHEFPQRTHEDSSADDYLRVIVESWDDHYIYGVTGSDGRESYVRVCYTHGSLPYHYDWSYLRGLLYPEVHLNLICPRTEGGILFPELIIIEPDYLVDISTVARCFTDYAESPLVHLVERSRPSRQSEAIMMGHLAGQMLDEQIHAAQSSRDYADMVRTFWQRHAISLLTTDIGRDFHHEARRQLQNIATALHRTLPQDVAAYRPGDGIIEPSFFSEMLGLQGRMDYLQWDFKLLLELKSGKGDFYRKDSTRPRYKDSHYVQMLLYMMLVRYNFRAIYHAGGDKLHAYLLYSKYPESLVGLGFDANFMFRAIRMRNRLAWMEMHYLPDNGKGYRVLEKLTPEKLNRKHRTDSLWRQYISPGLAAILAPIHQASDLERSYYFRFMRFVGAEHRLAKVGRYGLRKQEGGFAGRWYATVSERRRAGVLWDALRFVRTTVDADGSVTGFVLQLPGDADDEVSQFRRGDIIVAYTYTDGENPDIRKSLVYRATIGSIDETTLSLVLRAPQGNAAVFQREADRMWAIEPDFMESGYSALYRGLHSFLSATQRRRDLLLVRRPPAVDHSITLTGDYGEMNDLVCRAKQTRDLMLIVGPPGTGKTSRGLIFTLSEELQNPASSVLLLAYTNQAVDAICANLDESIDVDYIRLGSESSCAPAFRNHLLTRRVETCNSRTAFQNMLTSVRIYVATTTSMTSHISILDIKTFTLSIIDEASQILEPHLLPLFSAAKVDKPAIERFVLIGDHKQLPAVVSQSPEESVVEEAELRSIGLTDCRRSLFERLYSVYYDNPEVVYMLRRQGRMHPDVARFPNEAFYGGHLKEVPLPHQCTPTVSVCRSTHGIDRMISRHRVVFIHISASENESEGVNLAEADAIVATVVRLYVCHRGDFDPTRTVGVIVPYRAQIAAIRRRLFRSGIPALRDITVDTVERFQGSQRDTIVYGLTVQSLPGLSFLTSGEFFDVDGSLVDRKLNVAMTRAMNHLILVGNADILSANETHRRLIDFLRSQNAYFAPTPDIYAWGLFSVE